MDASDLKIEGAGSIGESAESAKIALAAGTKFTVLVEAADPENGYREDGTPVPSEHLTVRCLYPNGRRRNHQAADAAGLLPKVLTFARLTLGANEFACKSPPAELKTGTAIEIESV